ncbi:hypothetical protein [Flavobacterium sp. 25HG05S-40]|uniref:hypothetical protein n=1 Tax=Flavobacterium sp. 25HG05S-40 TaxID=3458682 RepID=UPI004043DE6D
MIIINNINTEKFSLNGIPYYKNFMGVVRGNKLKIVNVYDSELCLSELKNYDQYTVNGVVHVSVAALQNALLPVLYTRATLGGGGGGGSVVINPYTTFDFVKKGFGNAGIEPGAAGDVYQGWVSDGVYSIHSVYDGIGDIENPASFEHKQLIEY